MESQQGKLTEDALVWLDDIKHTLKKKASLTDLKQQYETLLSENHALKFKLEELNQECTAKDIKHRNDMQLLIDKAKKNNENSRALIMSLDLRAREAETRAEDAEEKTKKLFEDMAGTMTRALSAFPSLSQLPTTATNSSSGTPASVLLQRSFTVPPASRSPSPTKQKRPLKENRTPDPQGKRHKQEVNGTSLVLCSSLTDGAYMRTDQIPVSTSNHSRPVPVPVFQRQLYSSIPSYDFPDLAGTRLGGRLGHSTCGSSN
ncbi:hypothetical protein AAF712_003648 [Marasmius tenuissimus]|uniref:Uncharacterized protein n=1 Tax=Marasmius tenuissimus TaxID=585030 RepID=A0ABR3A6K1_9AGAR